MSSQPTQPAAAPGWYANGPVQRYWDGRAWTEHTAPLPAPQQPYQQALGPQMAVTRQRKQTSHLLHLVLTILTGGLWGILVWLPITLAHRFGRREKIRTTYR